MVLFIRKHLHKPTSIKVSFDTLHFNLYTLICQAIQTEGNKKLQIALGAKIATFIPFKAGEAGTHTEMQRDAQPVLEYVKMY